MKKILPSGLLLFVLALSSCCTKKDCITAFDQNEISLQGFTSTELDSIYVSSYPRGNGFQTAIEAGVASVVPFGDGGTDWLLILPVDLLPDREYRIEMNYPYQRFDITAIGTQQEACNSCFLKNDADFNVQMTGYELNYFYVPEKYFEIRK